MSTPPSADVNRISELARVHGLRIAVVESLTAGGLALFDADVCVVTTGVGGPDPEGGHEPGTVYLGWATGDGVGHLRLQLEGDPDTVLTATIAAACRLVRARTEEFRRPEHSE
ncbi:CinA family protein [Microbacterium sp. A196]|uniref:CinA family protein n=1 Tax=unclassified Microbacterium TaxID=2609290 RepID=UPI003FD1B17F